MKVRLIGSMCAALLCAYMIVSVLPVSGEDKIYTDMIRLHVLANSDADDDQKLKLEVRDEILTVVSDVLEGADGYDDAKARIEDGEERILTAAQRVVDNSGKNYSVGLELGQESYPERVYEGVTLPEGTYMSLRVLLGEGKGHNWWCVLYPPLCTTAAQKQEDVFISAGFTGDQYKAVKGEGKTKYKVKFKIAEIIGDIIGYNAKK